MLAPAVGWCEVKVWLLPWVHVPDPVPLHRNTCNWCYRARI